MKSTKAGTALTNLMDAEDLTNEQMALDLHVDATLISKMRNDKRNMVPDFATRSIDYADNEHYTMETAREFTRGRTAPRINGKSIDYENRLAVLLKTKEEITESLESLDMNLFLKRPEHATDDELKQIESSIKELKEGAWWALNSTATLTHEYNRPSKKLDDELTRKWKSKGVLK